MSVHIMDTQVQVTEKAIEDMNADELLAFKARLIRERAEFEAAKAKQVRLEGASVVQIGKFRLTLAVGAKGGVCVYGLGRWPTTLYREQMEALCEAAPAIKAFIQANDGKLKLKGEAQAPEKA